jgi:uncharacterized membrane protein
VSQASYRPSRTLAVSLIVFGILGWISAFALTLDKFALLEDPDAALSCNFSRFIQCGANLNSAQGAVFFDVPNPVWGLGGFVAPIAVGVAVLAGARFARWFWIAFNVGVAGAFAFVCWLIWQSIYFIGTLCPWCMLVWSVTIPMFLAVTLYSLKSGAIPVGDRGRRIAAALYGWIPAITIGALILIAVMAQLRIDVLQEFR